MHENVAESGTTPSREAGVAGRAVLIVSAGLATGVELASAFEALGAKVALVTDGAAQAGSADRVECTFASRDEIAQAFARAAGRIGPPALIVQAVLPQPTVTPQSIDAMSVVDWKSACLRALKISLHCLQASYRQLVDRGGTIVLIGGNVSFTGAANLVALSTVLEGQRALAKSAARQWGHHGIRVNWVAAAMTKLAHGLADAHLPEVPELGPPPPALGRVAELAEVASVIACLGNANAGALTGATLCIDGGDWMVP